MNADNAAKTNPNRLRVGAVDEKDGGSAEHGVGGVANRGQHQVGDVHDVGVQQRERLRATLESIHDGVIATDTRGRIELLNPAAEKLAGWSFASVAPTHTTLGSGSTHGQKPIWS